MKRAFPAITMLVVFSSHVAALADEVKPEKQVMPMLSRNWYSSTKTPWTLRTSAMPKPPFTRSSPLPKRGAIRIHHPI